MKSVQGKCPINLSEAPASNDQNVNLGLLNAGEMSRIAQLPEQEIDLAFCRHIAALRPDADLPFVDRMKFDIQKRSKKEQQLSTLKEIARRRTNNGIVVNQMLSRFQNDTERRNSRSRIVEAENREYERAKSTTSRNRTLSQKQGDELYRRLVRAHKEADHLRRLKRLVLQEYKAEEEMKELRKAYHPKLSDTQVGNLIKRFDNDTKRRQTSLSRVQKQKKREENEEIKGLFKPELCTEYKPPRRKKDSSNSAPCVKMLQKNLANTQSSQKQLSEFNSKMNNIESSLNGSCAVFETDDVAPEEPAALTHYKCNNLRKLIQEALNESVHDFMNSPNSRSKSKLERSRSTRSKLTSASKR